MKKANVMTVVKTSNSDGHEEKKDMYRLEDGEEKFYGLLGVGYGVNLVHCFSMGSKNKEMFWERVFAYRIIPNQDHAKLLEKATGENYLSVEFYELG